MILPPKQSGRAGFTLVELLVSTAIIALIMLVLLAITNQTTQTWQYTTEKIEKFQKARDAYESMTRRLSQATLNTYWEYLGIIPPNKTNIIPRPRDVSTQVYKDFVPLYYGRMSELRFISGPMQGTNAIVTGSATKNWPYQGVFFQAPFGLVEDDPDYHAMDNLLNTWGYFLEVDDVDDRPPFIDETIAPKRWRSRLMEFMQPAEKLMTNDKDMVTDYSTNWFSKGLTGPKPPVRTLAENIIAFVILPKLSKQDQEYRENHVPKWQSMLSPQYVYDSTLTVNPGISGNPATSTTGEFYGINPHHQLPPIVQVVMVALDERSAARLQAKYGKDATLGLETAAGKVGVNYGNLFTDASKLEQAKGDLYDLEQILVSENLTYRIFNSNVTIRGAKWSRSTKY